MPDPAPKRARPWRMIAEEASREFDPEKMLELIRELNQAMEEQGVGTRDRRTNPDEGKEKKSA